MLRDTNIQLYIGSNVLTHVGGKITAQSLNLDRNSLLDRLYPGRDDLGVPYDFFDQLDGWQESTLIVSLVYDGTIISTAQADLVRSDPDWNVVISNVITLDDFEGQGFGRRVMNCLEEAIKDAWPRARYMVLVNNPSKGNGGFYQSLGFRPRIDDRWLVVQLKRLLDKFGKTAPNETYLWVKML